MKKLSELEYAAWMLTAIGAINWGLYGAFKFDLVATVLGTSPQLAQAMYILIGLSGLYVGYKVVTVKK